MKFIAKSIKIKTFFLFIVFSILPGFAIVFYIIDIMQTEMKSNIEEKMLTGSVYLEQYINGYIYDRITPATERIREGFEDIEVFGITNTEKLIKKEIERGVLSAVYLYSETGKPVYRQFTETMPKEIDSLGPKFLREIKEQYREQFCYVKDKNSPSVFFLYLNKLKMGGNEYYQISVSDIGKNVFAKISDSNYPSALSVLIYDSKNNLLFQKISDNIPEPTAESFIKKLHERFKDTDKPIGMLKWVNDGDESYLLMFNYSDKNKLSIISFIPEKVAFAQIYKLIKIAIALLIFTIIFVLFANYFSISVITTPLLKLKDAAAKAARGNFDVKAEVKTEDEIGQLARTFNKMIRELKVFNQINIDKIIAEKLKLDKILQGMGDGVLVINEFNRVILVNDRFREWFNCKEQKILGKEVSNFAQFSIFMDLYNETLTSEDNKVYYREYKIKQKEAMEIIYIQAGAVKIITKDNKYIGVTFILRDITKDKEIARMKDEMISFIAHELRSPLVSIIGFSEFLKEGGLSEEEIQEFASIIHKEGKRMHDFINDFLDLSKLERGISSVKKSRLEIRQYIIDKVDSFRPKALTKNIELETDIPDEEIHTETFARLLDIILDNYISNAIKYSPEKTTVRIVLKKEETRYKIEVQDQGYGIDEKDQQRVFDNFYRVDSNPKLQGIEGTGLGLALVKKSAKQMGGYVYLESKLGKGSTFGVSLPIQQENNN